MRLRRILAIVRPGAAAQPGVERAVALARATGARLSIASVVYDAAAADGIFSRHRDEHEEMRAELRDDALAELRRVADATGYSPVAVEAVWGHPFDRAVLGLIAADRPDLLLMQPRGPARTRLSTAEWRLLRESPIPVWLARKKDWTPGASVVSLVDPQAEREWADRAVLAHGAAVAAALDVPHAVLHGCGEIPDLIQLAQDRDEYEREFEAARCAEIRRLLPAGTGSEPEIRIRPTDAIGAFGRCYGDEPVCVLVVGSLARRSVVDRLIGSTTRLLVARTSADLLFVPTRP